MDIDALHSTLVSLTLLPEELRSARETLTKADGAARPELVELLSSTERDLRIAKATLARELGLEVCLCCWPPEMLAFHDSGETYCPRQSEEEASAGLVAGPRVTAATIAPGSAAASARLIRRHRDVTIGCLRASVAAG